MCPFSQDSPLSDILFGPHADPDSALIVSLILLIMNDSGDEALIMALLYILT